MSTMPFLVSFSLGQIPNYEIHQAASDLLYLKKSFVSKKIKPAKTTSFIYKRPSRISSIKTPKLIYVSKGIWKTPCANVNKPYVSYETYFLQGIETSGKKKTRSGKIFN